MKANPIIINRARELLARLKEQPSAFASTKESFINMITVILQMADVNFIVHSFWKKHLGTQGSMFLGINDLVISEWANQVVDDAMHELELKEIFPLERDKYDND